MAIAGALAGAQPGTIVVECSTVTWAACKSWPMPPRARDATFVDAPVTGSKMQAAAGELALPRRRGGRRAGAHPARARGDGQDDHPSRPGRQRRAREADQQLPLRRAGRVARRSDRDDRAVVARSRPGNAGDRQRLAGKPGHEDADRAAFSPTTSRRTSTCTCSRRTWDTPSRRARAAAYRWRRRRRRWTCCVARSRNGDGDRDMAAVVQQFREATAAR